jgi:uncharacterized membrane protein
MTATSIDAPWPRENVAAPRRAGGLSDWSLGREVALSAGPDAPKALQWLLRRNCSVTPRQLATAYALLCTLSLGVALFFVLMGAPMVLAFAGIELLFVGAALLVCARHAGDRETLTLVGGSLLVEQAYGPRLERATLAAHWLTVEPLAGQNSLVVLAGEGRSLRVGRHLRPELRGLLARELRWALRQSVEGRTPAWGATQPQAS